MAALETQAAAAAAAQGYVHADASVGRWSKLLFPEWGKLVKEPTLEEHEADYRAP